MRNLHRWSPSRLSDFSCPRKVWYRDRDWARATVSNSLAYGIMAHGGLSRALTDGDYEDGIRLAYEGMIKENGMVDEEIDSMDDLKGEVVSILSAYKVLYDRQHLPDQFLLDAVEKENLHAEIKHEKTLSIFGGREVTLSGIVDFCDGNTIIEHKTGRDRPVDIMKKYQYTPQPGFYEVLLTMKDGATIEEVVNDPATMETILSVVSRPTIRQKKDESVVEFHRRLYKDCIDRPTWYFGNFLFASVPKRKDNILKSILASSMMIDALPPGDMSYWFKRCGVYACDYATMCNADLDPEERPDVANEMGYIRKERG